ncbi:MAG: flavin reductase [Calditrichaeota bacterium]|nr:MAG: flavin reductase [Calditrichota bacterium]
MPVSSAEFKRTLGTFATGVTIVTIKNPQGIHGLTVNSFTSVSLNPPLILICIQKEGTSHQQMVATDAFVVNILSATQRELAERFARSDLGSQARFDKVKYKLNKRGIPILEDNLATLECRIVDQFEGGDHTIFLAEVENTWAAEDKPALVYYRRNYYEL